MVSLRDIVIGSDEYVKIVKKAEQEGRVDELLMRIETDVDGIYREGAEFTEKQRIRLRGIRREVSELIDEGW